MSRIHYPTDNAGNLDRFCPGSARDGARRAALPGDRAGRWPEAETKQAWAALTGMATMQSIEHAAARPTRRRLSLPWPEWPRADQVAWERAISPASLLDDEGGLAASWRPRS